MQLICDSSSPIQNSEEPFVGGVRIRNINNGNESNGVRITRERSRIFKSSNRNENEISEIHGEEIISFLDSLNEEREEFKLSKEDILKSELLISEIVKGEIVGIAGIRRHFGIPMFLIVVKSEFQGRHIGSSLAEKLIEIAKHEYLYILLSVSKNNERAICLYKKRGYKMICEIPEAYYMFCPLAKRGEILFWILRFCIPIGMMTRRIVLLMREFKTRNAGIE